MSDDANVYRTLAEAGPALDRPIVTIGNFDGLHLGHRAILERARDHARRRDAETEAVALTFSPHPVRYFRPDAPTFRLTTDASKHALLTDNGADAIVALSFDDWLADLSPADFVGRILAEGLGASRVVVGRNFRFGRERAGSTDDLDRLAGEHGIDCSVCDHVRTEGEVVSSTRIREAVRAGRVAAATELLGRPYRLTGRVERGEQRGRRLGFPTANLDPAHLVPGNGIYAARAYGAGLDGHPAATSIGVRPTYGGDDRAVEVHLVDWEGDDLYGAELQVAFERYLREEREFETEGDLREQMARDVARVREQLET